MRDQKLVESIRSGANAPALDKLYDGFPAVRQLICSKGGDEESARDVFQEALVIFIEKVRKPEFKLEAAASTYLYSVCRFLWLDRLRKSGKEIAFEQVRAADEADEDELEAHLAREEKFNFIEHALDQIGDRCKQLLKLFYYQKDSMKTISSKLGFSSERSAKTQKYKCIERARNLAREQFPATNTGNHA